jgi:rhodanese-related sulfurtransferase
MADEISPEGLAARLAEPNPPIIIDVREEDERGVSKIPEAIWIPMNDVPQRLEELSRDQEYVIQCRSGSRSMKVADFMIANGFTSVLNLATGINGWADTVDPTMKKY